MTKPLHVLYLEDSPSNVELLQITLERYNKASTISLSIVETVEEAKQQFDAQRHVGAILDWNLPDGDGLEVAAHIRSLSQDTSIIFLSGTFTEENIIKAQKYQPAACLEKDYSRDHINKIVAILEGK